MNKETSFHFGLSPTSAGKGRISRSPECANSLFHYKNQKPLDFGISICGEFRPFLASVPLPCLVTEGHSMVAFVV
jgi:hypothetical protein